MRNAETVLGVIRERGRRGLPLEDVYRQLYNPTLYLLAYGRLYQNAGAMTEGTTLETVDGMSLAKIESLIEQLRCERYRWTPVRRVTIPKPHQVGKYRPLGIPTWSDKLLQEVIRLLLEAYYEPQFSDHSHGFRPRRGCHTALTEITHTWKGVKWFVEGDIRGCFDTIDHTILLSILRERIHDNRFLRLIENLLKAGYLQQWTYRPTLSGVPQGGVLSPLLSNIYLDRLDRYVADILIPQHTRGTQRRKNSDYARLAAGQLRAHRRGERTQARKLRQQKRQLPVFDVHDPGYRRLRYVRYADDFLLGFVGPKAEARQIKEQLQTFLQEHLKLELSAEKTLLSHAATQPARFLGYEIIAQYANDRLTRQGTRSVNGVLALRLPLSVVKAQCAPYLRRGKPIHTMPLTLSSDFDIVAEYGQKYRGIVQYYLLAQNVAYLSRLCWIMETSLLKTLACKHKSTGREMAAKYTSRVPTEHGPRKCLVVVIPREGKKALTARFGGIPLRRRKMALLKDPFLENHPSRNELLKRLLAERCEVCGSEGKVEVHHVRKLADVHPKGRVEKPYWMQIMSARRRKTLVLCARCHDDLHTGRLKRPLTK